MLGQVNNNNLNYPISNYTQTNQISDDIQAINRNFVLTSLTNNFKFMNHPDRIKFLNTVLDTTPVHLSNLEKLNTFLEIYSLLNGNSLQQHFFQMMYDQLELEEFGYEKDQQSNLIRFLSKLYENTRDKEIRSFVKTWFTHNTFTTDNKTPIDPNKKIPIFGEKPYNTIHNLPAHIKKEINPILHLCVIALQKQVESLFTQESFRDNPTECLNQIMNEYAHVFKQIHNRRNKNHAILVNYLHTLVHRAIELITNQMDHIEILLSDKHKFDTAENKEYYSSFMEQVLRRANTVPMPEQTHHTISPDIAQAKLFELFSYFKNYGPPITLNIEAPQPNVVITRDMPAVPFTPAAQPTSMPSAPTFTNSIPNQQLNDHSSEDLDVGFDDIDGEDE
ncbi:hypothetical protein ACFL2K_02260 [Candidatus Margulisiibacteriota bacterium]